ncbi:BRCT domain-containing protein, partial [Cucurbita argyrosperma subsp. sororia]
MAKKVYLLGVQFVLFGFNHFDEKQIQATLIYGGGVDIGQYGPNCTHVIVNKDKIVYDDPVCVMTWTGLKLRLRILKKNLAVASLKHFVRRNRKSPNAMKFCLQSTSERSNTIPASKTLDDCINIVDPKSVLTVPTANSKFSPRKFDSSQAGKFLMEEPYEWHKNGLTEYSAINLKAPRKCRLLRARTGHGAFYGMRSSIIYGESIAPPLDTLKHAVKAGDGTILATSPPYTKFLKSGVDLAVVSPARHVLICGSKSS